MASEVLVPSSPAEAVELFGDGAGTTVVGGGTVVVPDMTYGRLDPERVLLLSRAGLARDHDGGRPRSRSGRRPRSARSLELEGQVAALAACARNVADYEVRGQATVGGNLCGYGDLQGCLLALDATARSAGADGERTRAAGGVPRRTAAAGSCSTCRSSCPPPRRSSVLEYPHTHEYTVLAVTGVRTAGGETRLAATGVAGPGARLRSAEALASDPGGGRLPRRPSDVTFADDALASAWYREQTLPVLVRRVLNQLEESA